MPRRVARTWPSALAAAAALLLAATACTVGPSQRPALVIGGSPPPAQAPSAGPGGSTGPRPLPPLERPGDAAISWSDCDDTTRQRLGPGPTVPAGLRFQCARVVTPLDSPSAPGRGIAHVSLLKVGSGATPLLVLNDLGAEPGTLWAAELAGQLPAQFLRTFSLIGMDRRGTGDSDGVHCVPGADREEIIDYDPTSTDLSDLLSASRDGSQQCVLALDTRAAALDTQRTAEDLESIRQQLGVGHLNAIGRGEGSRVLTAYANRYPDRTGRLVLDGSPDPTADATDIAKARAAGAQAAFGAFASDCVARGCPLGRDPTTAVTQFLGRVRRTEQSLPDGSVVTNGTVLNAILMGLANRSEWPALASALAAAIAGDGSGLIDMVNPVVLGLPGDPARLDAFLVSGCNDEQARPAPGQVADLVTSLGAQAPMFGGLIAQRLLWCAPWPVPEQALPRPTAHGAPPILVLSTANDPITPATGTERTAQQLDSGILVNWLGSGHGALGASACATQAAQEFLVNGQLPANPTTCPA